ncbi:MAG: PilZ domain-containing protein [Candidatus Sericytochromatia bacterium]|nr:PilZ domain-containing protein [Candidatus Tanganyikabacteria bacterium]
MVAAFAQPPAQFHDEDALSALMQTLGTPADRRTTPRFEVQYTVEFDGQRARGLCTDISLSGMRVRLTGEGFVNDLNDLKCWIWIQGGLIRLTGKVVRVARSREVAIRFTGPLNAVGRMRLNQYVAGTPRTPDEAGEFRKVVSLDERRPSRGTRPPLKQESGFLVIDEVTIPHIAARQAEKKRQEDAARARAVAGAAEAAKGREADGDDAGEFASPPHAEGKPFVSTMSRNRGVSLMKFWIDRRSSHHH